jgi:hypothetical protein
MIPDSLDAWASSDCTDSDGSAFVETYKNEEVFLYAAKNWLHGDEEIIKFMRNGGVIAARKA